LLPQSYTTTWDTTAAIGPSPSFCLRTLGTASGLRFHGIPPTLHGIRPTGSRHPAYASTASGLRGVFL